MAGEYTMYEIYEGNGWQHDARRVNTRHIRRVHGSTGWFNRFRIDTLARERENRDSASDDRPRGAAGSSRAIAFSRYQSRKSLGIRHRDI